MEKDTYCKELKRIHDGILNQSSSVNLSDYLAVIRDLYVHCSSKPLSEPASYPNLVIESGAPHYRLEPFFDKK
jgi:hypothetical protein